MAKKKDDKKKGAAPEPAGEDLRPRLSAHPRARHQIRQSKAWAAIVGFALVGLLSWQAGQPVFDAGVRALAAGLVCYVVGWAIAVIVWRHVARAEVELAEARFTAQAAEQAAP